MLICLSGKPFTLAEPTVIRISGPPVAESLAFAIMSERPFDQGDFKLLFIPWNSPDQARALIAGEKIDGAIITTSAASVFHNRGIKVKIAALFESPLWVVSTSDSVCDKAEDLKGVLFFPFGPREMPELLFNAVCKKISPPVIPRHAGGALECVNNLLLHRGKHALLAEPAATMAVVRSRESMEEGVPGLVKNIDIRKLWREQFHGKKLLVSCFAMFGKAAEQTEMISILLAEYEKELAFIANHPEKTLGLAMKNFPALAAQSQNNRIPGIHIHIERSERAFADAIFFLKEIHMQSARSTGGSVPGKEIFMEIK